MAHRLGLQAARLPARANRAEWIDFHGLESAEPLSRRGCTPRSFGTGGGTGNFSLYSDLSDYPTKEEERRGSSKSDASRLVGRVGCPAATDWAGGRRIPRVRLDKIRPLRRAQCHETLMQLRATRTHEAASLTPGAAAYPHPASEPSSGLFAATRTRARTVGYSNRVSTLPRTHGSQLLPGALPTQHPPRTV